MKTFAAVTMGFLSGFLVYIMAGLLVIDVHGTQQPSAAFITVTLVGAWAASTMLLLRNARTTGKVISRGFLLGAAEWMLMLVVGIIFSGRAVGASVASSSSSAEAAGAAFGGGLVVFITGGLSVAMAIVCLIGFAISYSLGKEMKPELAAPTRKCPECAELVQQEAKRCRFCGTSLVSSSTGV